MGDLSRNFSFWEFFTEGKEFMQKVCLYVPDCYRRIKDRLVDPIAQPLRDYLNTLKELTINGLIEIALKITSGVRSDAYNATLENASPNSHHLFKKKNSAFDFRVINKKTGEIIALGMALAWKWLMAHRSRFCFAYWEQDMNFIHVSGLTPNDPRVGRMWTVKNGKKNYEPVWDGKDAA